MKYMALTFKNIKKFIIHHPVMFTLFVMVQIICCVAAFITCGMANNMYVENEKVTEYSTFSFNFELNLQELEDLFDNRYTDIVCRKAKRILQIFQSVFMNFIMRELYR